MLRQRAIYISTLVLLYAAVSDGHLCYSCVYSGGHADQTCVDTPTIYTPIDCPNSRYCTTQRMEYVEGGNIYSFGRFCSDPSGSKPLHLNETVPDSGFITHFTACDWDLCNVGDGVWKKTVKPPLNVPGKGKGKGAAVVPLTWLATMTTAAIALVVGRHG